MPINRNAKTPVKPSSRLSKRRCEMRLINQRPSHIPGRTTGASMAFRKRVSTSISPKLALNGTLKTLIIKKNQAVVPTNSHFGKLTASKYRAITGPAAFASIVVIPTSKPRLQANHFWWGILSNHVGRHIRATCTQVSVKIIVPTSGLKIVSGNCFHHHPSDHNTTQSGREQSADVIPLSLLAEVTDGADIAHNQQWKQDSSSLASAKQESKNDDVDHSHALKSAFRKSDSKGCKD